MIVGLGTFAESEVIRPRYALLPKVVTSSDGFIRVVAPDVPGDELGFRTPILSFASRVVRSLSEACDLPLERHRMPGVIIHAEVARTNDTRVLVRILKREGRPQTHIVLPSAAYSDVEQLRVEVGKAFFRAWFAEAFPNNGDARTAADELPPWLVQGAFRMVDVEQMRADRRFVVQLWYAGRLPFFPALCTDLRVSQGPAVALAGYLAGWMREKHLFRTWLTRLAQGDKWDGERLAVELTGQTDPIEQDRAHDERMVKLLRAVLSPGQTTDLDVRVFSSRLELQSPLFEGFPENRQGFSFREIAREAGTNEMVRLAARAFAKRVPFFAIGRSDLLQQSARDYADFLNAVADGEKEALREGLLDKADAAFLRARLQK